MQLNVTTDYGIRVVLYLAQRNTVVSGADICANMGIPCSYMHKIAKVLKNADIISEKRGAIGGFMLKKAADAVSILDIVSAFEKTMNINKCLEDDEFCSRNAVPYCVVRALYAEVQDRLNDMLNVKISTLISRVNT
ncbi:MAG: Rrf2 family transcriptional regulator [Nitrososphaerota archaeon]|jgi:Rrf2 family protein|nr:Rrf2 family transcriptional regulator [Nitrososphaerota archaeon]